jgi:hypothetical protein
VKTDDNGYLVTLTVYQDTSGKNSLTKIEIPEMDIVPPAAKK